MIWKILLGIVAIIVCLPIIIYLLRLLAGILAFCLGAVGLVLLFTGNVGAGIGVIVVALILGIFAPETDPDIDVWWWYW